MPDVTGRDSVAEWFEKKQALLDSRCKLPSFAPVEISDAEPPAFSGKDNNEAFLDVESLLGCYHPEEKRIVLWRRGIEFAAHRVRHKYETLFELVMVHEYGHWFHNEASAMNRETPPMPIKWKPEVLDDADRYYHEAWAQWFTWVYANTHEPRLVEAFLALNRRQSEPYHAWKSAFTSVKESQTRAEQQHLDLSESRQKIVLMSLRIIRRNTPKPTVEQLQKALDDATMELWLENNPNIDDVFGTMVRSI